MTATYREKWSYDKFDPGVLNITFPYSVLFIIALSFTGIRGIDLKATGLHSMTKVSCYLDLDKY